MPQVHGAGNKPRKILVVDDEPLVCHLLQRFFQKEPRLSVDTAQNGHQALQKAAATRYDLVITDLIMPGINGDELARILKQQDPSRPVVLLTAMPSEQTPPAVDCQLTKSLSLEILRQELSPYLDDPAGE